MNTGVFKMKEKSSDFCNISIIIFLHIGVIIAVGLSFGAVRVLNDIFRELICYKLFLNTSCSLCTRFDKEPKQLPSPLPPQKNKKCRMFPLSLANRIQLLPHDIIPQS